MHFIPVLEGLHFKTNMRKGKEMATKDFVCTLFLYLKDDFSKRIWEKENNWQVKICMVDIIRSSRLYAFIASTYRKHLVSLIFQSNHNLSLYFFFSTVVVFFFNFNSFTFVCLFIDSLTAGLLGEKKEENQIKKEFVDVNNNNNYHYGLLWLR